MKRHPLNIEKRPIRLAKPALLLAALCALLCFAGHSMAKNADAPVRRDHAGAEAARVAAPNDASGARGLTLMVYIIGSDLEGRNGAATADIVEMMGSGFDFQNNNLVIMTGGTTQWRKTTGIPNDALTIYEVGKQALTEAAQFKLASMGAAETLTGFLDYCHKNYPANEYALILWNHGAGPMGGYGVDTNFGNDGLTLFEMRQAMHQSPFGGENKLSFVGFDACLMASVETAYIMQDYAEYMIASEETMPEQGFDYRFLGKMGASATDGKAVGKLIVDHFMEYYIEKTEQLGEAIVNELTLSCLDLSKTGRVESALDALFTRMDASLAQGKYSEIAQKRGDVKGFAKFTTGSNYDLIDLMDLSAQFSPDYPAEAKALTDALTEMIVYNRAKPERANGLTIYYPFDNKAYYQSQWGQEYATFGFAPAYTAFMGKFGSILLGDSLADWSGAKAPKLGQDAETQEFYLQLSEEQAQNYESGAYFIVRRVEDNRYLLRVRGLGVTLDENNRLYANMNSNALNIVVGDLDSDDATVLMPVYFDYSEGDAKSKFMVPAVLANLWMEERADALFEDDPEPIPEPESMLAYVLGVYSSTQEAAPMLSAIPDPEDASAPAVGKNEELLADWEIVNFFDRMYEMRTRENGDPLPVDAWEFVRNEGFTAYGGDSGFHAVFRPLADEGIEYYCQIVMYDTQGNAYASELIPVPLSEIGQAKLDEKLDGIYSKLPAKEPREVTFSTRTGAPAKLVETKDVTITLTDIKPMQNGIYGTAPALCIHVRNDSDENMSIPIDGLYVNGYSVGVDECARSQGENASSVSRDGLIVPAHSSADGYIVIDVAGQGALALFMENVDTMRTCTIQFGFTSSKVQINTNFQIGKLLRDADHQLWLMNQDQYRKLPLQKQTILNTEWGITATLVAGYESESDIALLLYFDNDSEYFDVVSEDTVYAGNTSVETRLRILGSNTLAKGTRSYAWMTISQDALRTANCARLDAVSVRFAISQSVGTAGAATDAPYKRSDAVTIQLPGVSYRHSPRSDEGIVLVDQGGVKVTALTELQNADYAGYDPERPSHRGAIRLLVENNSGVAVRIISDSPAFNGRAALLFPLSSALLESGTRCYIEQDISDWQLEDLSRKTLKTFTCTLTADDPSAGVNPFESVPITIPLQDDGRFATPKAK